MAAATLSVGVLLAILEAVPEIRVPFRVYSHHSSKLGGKSQGGRPAILILAGSAAFVSVRPKTS